MEYLQELARTLFERRHEAVRVPFRDCSGPDVQPVIQDCHRNVGVWCRARPQTRPVRGWLVLERYPCSDVCRFVAHSVVDEHGVLFDATPLGAAKHYPFLRHPHTDEEFILMLSRRGLIYIDHRL
jgi:hypothetical protein